MTDLRDQIAEALSEVTFPREPSTTAHYLTADEVMTVVQPVLDAKDAEIARLSERASPFYSHPKCGFHWHGRDDLDIPIRDQEPICPRCELTAAVTRANRADAERDQLKALLPALVRVAVHVSRGRRMADEGVYPDATARFALGALHDAGLMPEQPEEGDHD